MTASTATVRCWEVSRYAWGVCLCLQSALPVVIGTENRRGYLIKNWGNKHLDLIIKTDSTHASVLRKQESKIRWVRYLLTMIKSLWKRTIQIPMLFNFKIPAGNCLIPVCDDATPSSAFMLVQHLCHHWLHGADSSFLWGRWNNWRSSWSTRMKCLEIIIWALQSPPKYLPLEVSLSV